MKLHRRTFGNGPDLLLLHGWGMNSTLWSPLVDCLADRFRLTLVDLPGHGASSIDPALTCLDSWAEAVLAVAPKHAVWLGWSLGGLVMQHAVATRPDAVRAAVGIATTPCFVRRPGWPWGMEQNLFEEFGQALADEPQATLRRFLTLQVQGSASGREQLRGIRRQMSGVPSPSPLALEVGLRLLLESDLRQTSMPVEACWLLGGRDTLVSAATTGWLARRGQVEVIDGAAHAPFISHTEHCAKAIREFVDNV